MRISDWSSDVCSSDLELAIEADACNLSGADLLPKLSFGVGCIQSEFARARGRSFVALVQQALPRPLPQAGREMCAQSPNRFPSRLREGFGEGLFQESAAFKLGRASGRERVCQ